MANKAGQIFVGNAEEGDAVGDIELGARREGSA